MERAIFMDILINGLDYGRSLSEGLASAGDFLLLTNRPLANLERLQYNLAR